MKKLILALALLTGASAAFAMPKALYVKKGDTYTKYNFGVASNLKFSNDGKTLTITGYGQAINLDEIDYITFSAPIDQTAISPSAQKEKMVAIGEEINSMVDLEKNADLIRMINRFTGERSISQDGECKWIDSVAEYEWPEDFWNFKHLGVEVMKSIASMAKGNPAAARVFKAKMVDLYRAQDYFGVYTADDEKLEWVKTGDADYLQINFRGFNNEAYSATLRCSDDYTVWNTKDFAGQMPRTMTLTLAQDGKEIGKAEINTTLVQDQSIDMAVIFEANGSVVNNTLNIVNNLITDKVIVTIDGRQFCVANTVINGKNLVKYDEMFDAIKESTHYHDADDNCCGEDPTELLAHIFRGKTDVDVLGKLQVKGNIFNPSKLYEEIGDDVDNSPYLFTNGGYTYHDGVVLSNENGIIRTTHDDRAIEENRAKYLNNYVDATFYYDGKPQMQGFLSFDVYEEIEDGYVSPDNEWGQYGYVIIDGKLVSVRKECHEDWDPVAENFVKVWDEHYHFTVYTDTDSKDVTVADADVIKPAAREYCYYETLPQLVFPDLTTFWFDDYFDEGSFSKLIDDYEEIVDTYLNITGQDEDDEVEPDHPAK